MTHHRLPWTAVLCLGAVLPSGARANLDYLQPWHQLPRDPAFRMTESGHEGYTGDAAVLAFGPWRAVPYLEDALRQLAAHGFGDGGRTVLTLRELEDRRAVRVLLDVTLPGGDDTAEAARLLGTLGAQEAVAQLVRYLDEADYNLRAKALQGLVLMRSQAAVPGIVAHGLRILPQVDSPQFGHGAFLSDLCMGLGRLGDRRAIPFLRKVLAYPFPFDDHTRTLHKSAAEGLAMLGDTASAAPIAALPNELEAARMLRLPVALERANDILGDPDRGEEGTGAQLGGAWILAALRIYADLGTPADIPAMRRRVAALSKLSIDVMTGGEPPFGYGAYVVENRNLPVLGAWSLASMGDPQALLELDRWLQHEDSVVSSEAARALVMLGRTERYPAIERALRAQVGRTSYGCEEMERRYGYTDRAIHARMGLMRILGEQQTAAALRLLTELANDCNINGVLAARQAIRSYPPRDALTAVVKQFHVAGEWERWQLASLLELFGEDGLRVLYALALRDPDPARRAVAARAVIRAEYGDWEALACRAAADASPGMKELTEWVDYRFQYYRPGFRARQCGGR